jgi:hypothetical protein
MDRFLPFLKQPSDDPNSGGGYSGADRQSPDSPKYEGIAKQMMDTFPNPEGAEVWATRL